MLHHPLIHREPIIRIATKRGRRIFLLLGSLAFVLCSTLIGGVALRSIAAGNTTQIKLWIMLIIAPIGIIFFGIIAIGVLKNHFGAQGKTALIMSPVGFTDQTQIIGPLKMIPWTLIVQYDLVAYRGQQFILLQLRDPQAYLQIVGSSRIMRWAFKANSKIFGVPVHQITVQHLQAEETEVLDAMFHLSGLPPGHRAAPL